MHVRSSQSSWYLKHRKLLSHLHQFEKAQASRLTIITGANGERKTYDVIVQQSGKIRVFGQGVTHGGCPAPCAGAFDTPRILEGANVISHASQISQTLQNGLRAFATHTLAGEVRGGGLIGAIELISGKIRKTINARIK